MQQIQTDVLVIGGGATGTGVLRDLAMRGFRCVLVERRDLAYGTTGRYHGLLHSGARYAVKDPQAARECYEENQILRRIMPHCIEDTGGYFVSTPNDDRGYIPKFIEGCKSAGIPIEEISIQQMLKVEPLLNPKIYHCFRVPDAAADSFLAAQLNAESARMHGGIVLTYHEFKQLLVSNQSKSGIGRVTGAICQDVIKNEEVQINASMVVNASGAWAGKIASTAGIELTMLPGKGTMLAVNHRIVNTVINRCKPPSDGDILVPTHTVAVMGTTDIKVADPDRYAIEPWEIRLMLEEGEKIIPGFKQLRILRAWAGVRPLVQTGDTTEDRDISRSFVLLDHAVRDGVDGIITITSGKWTTYRKMAQVTVDKVCEKLDVQQPCRTHLEPLPVQQHQSRNFYQAAHRLEKIERYDAYGSLVCECELVSRDEVEQAIIQDNSVTLDDIRRTTRLGMGPCQGAFCTFRATGILQSLHHLPIEETNNALLDFLEERWKGDLPVLSGKQLQQARFNELIYVNILNAPHLPGERNTTLSPEPYLKPERTTSTGSSRILPAEHMHATSIREAPTDVIIIGSGIAGLTAGWQLGSAKKSVNMLTRGWGTPYWASGCIDIFGHEPPNYSNVVNEPRIFLEKFILSNPEHPYALAGLATIDAAIQSFLELSSQSNYPFYGSLDINQLIPTALGTLRPTCLVPSTMVSGNAALKTPMLIIGFDGYLDFYPELVAKNLSAQGLIVDFLSIDLPSLGNRKFLSAMVLARLFDESEFQQEVIDALKSRLSKFERIGFPAVLGLHHSTQVVEHLQSSLGVPVFELPGLPPSIPGIRLHNMLVTAIERGHGTIHNGNMVITASMDGDKIQSVWSEAAARQKEHTAATFVLATGGFLAGGFIAENTDYAQEMIFNLPLTSIGTDTARLSDRFINNHGHPIFRTGVRSDPTFHPLDQNDQPVYSNLFAIGNALGNCDPVREQSIEGIALVTGYRVAEIISADTSK